MLDGCFLGLYSYGQVIIWEWDKSGTKAGQGRDSPRTRAGQAKWDNGQDKHTLEGCVLVLCPSLDF